GHRRDGTLDGQVVRDVQVPGGAGVLVRAGAGQEVRARRQDDGVGAGQGVRLHDGGTQRGVAAVVPGQTVAGRDVHRVQRGVDGERGRHGAVFQVLEVRPVVVPGAARPAGAGGREQGEPFPRASHNASTGNGRTRAGSADAGRTRPPAAGNTNQRQARVGRI